MDFADRRKRFFCNQLLSEVLSKQKTASPKMKELTKFKYEYMVPRGRLELPTHGFSGE